jgi:hypothetical protein
MPKVIIGQRYSVNLGNQDVLGSGGEGTVFRTFTPSGNLAVKIYHDPTRERLAKIRDLIPLSTRFPSQVIGPLDLVYDAQAIKPIGFSMRLLAAGLQPLETLMSKKQRELNGVTNKEVVRLYQQILEALEKLHFQEVIIGDLNPLNEFYLNSQVALTDADSFQFGRYPCAVATERCLNPRLYGIDLSVKPTFEKTDDWYAFWVLFFSSLLLVHPYGGAHRSLKTIPRRALSRITVLDQSVVYPKTAYPQEVASDDLLEIFTKTFGQGKIVLPEIRLLEEFGSILVSCPNCGLFYPGNRRKCPGCLAANRIAQIKKTQISGVRTTELLATNGPIVFFRLIHSTIYCIANESSEAVLYIKKQLEKPRRMVISKANQQTRYEVFSKYLAVCEKPYADEPILQILDISGSTPAPVASTSTQRIGGRGAVYRGSKEALYRLAGGILIRGTIPFGTDLVEETIATVLDNQTWFDVADNQNNILVGYYRIFNRLEWFLVNNGKQMPLQLNEMDQGESLIDKVIRFSATSVLVLRRTKKSGKEYCRIETLDIQTGQRLSSRTVAILDCPQYDNFHNIAYGRGTILFTQNDGLLAENAETGNQKTFPQTINLVDERSQLWLYGQGLLAVSDNRVTEIVLGN